MDKPILPPRWRRNYAHVLNLEIACPRCGRLYRTRANVSKAQSRVYDPATGIFECVNGGCRGRYYVGVILWPAGKRSARPEDHTLTPGEAAELRWARNAVSLDPPNGGRRGDTDAGQVEYGADGRVSVGRRRVQINLVCTCGEGCAVHPARAPEGDEG